MTYTTTAISGAALGKAIKSIAKRGANLDKDTQSCLVQCLIQLKDHRNMDYATKMIRAMGRSQRANAAVTYLQSMAPCIKAKMKGKTFVSFGKSAEWTKDDLPVDVVQAEQIAFWNFVTEATPVTITLVSLEKRLATLIKTASDNLTDGELEVFIGDLHRVELTAVA